MDQFFLRFINIFQYKPLNFLGCVNDDMIYLLYERCTLLYKIVFAEDKNIKIVQFCNQSKSFVKVHRFYASVNTRDEPKNNGIVKL